MVDATQKLGIDEVVKVALFVADLGNAAGKVEEDGGLSFGDIDDVFHAATSLKDLLAVDFKGKFLPEVKDMDEGELKTVIAAFDEHFDIPEANIKAAVEGALALSVKIFDLVKECEDWTKHLNAAS